MQRMSITEDWHGGYGLVESPSEPVSTMLVGVQIEAWMKVIASWILYIQMGVVLYAHLTLGIGPPRLVERALLAGQLSGCLNFLSGSTQAACMHACRKMYTNWNCLQ